MKTSICLMALGFAFIAPQLSLAQAPAGAPAGSTALCTDGTYSKSTSKMTACVGHKGVKTWFGAPTTSTTKPTTTTPATSGYTSTKTPPTTPTKPAPTTTPTTTTAPTGNTPPKSTTPPTTPPTTPTTTANKPPTGGSSAAPAPGGGPNLVWENTGGSKVYHCPGTTYYGKTKAGKYVTEAQAKADGYHPNGGKACFK